MRLGQLTYSNEIADQLSHIPWNELNKRFKRDYNKVIEYILGEIEKRGGDKKGIEGEVNRIFVELERLQLQRLHRKKTPPS
jgi:hypothetical protein